MSVPEILAKYGLDAAYDEWVADLIEELDTHSQAVRGGALEEAIKIARQFVGGVYGNTGFVIEKGIRNIDA